MNIESILKYQSVDAKIHDIEQKLLNSNFKKKANELSAIAKKAQTRSTELETEAEKVLADIEDLKNKYQINKSKSDEVCAKSVEGLSVDELEKLAALKNKIANNLNILEKLLQKSAESINNILSNFNKTKKTFDDAKSQYAVCKQKIDEETAALEPEKKKLEAELSKMESSVDPQLLAEYKKKRNDRIFPVVCALEGENFCGGCRMELPKVAISRIKDTGVITCEHCKRILYKK